jgi:uncharacterized protein YecE (DUF72 family)
MATALRERRPGAAALRPVHVGCSGWNYRSWRERFYTPGTPVREWLSSYAERFETVEVNTTFYRLIARTAVEHWVEQTPPEFIFAVKASRFLTHVKRLTEIGDGVARFYERIEPLAACGRLGPVLWQLPETFQRDEQRLSRALAALPPGRHAFECRHPSWFAPEVLELLREHGAALVIGDHPDRPFQTDQATTGWRYVRFHYGRRGRRGNYSESELDEWAERLHRYRRATEVFVYFNNDWEGFAPRNAAGLLDRLRRLEQTGTSDGRVAERGGRRRGARR